MRYFQDWRRFPTTEESDLGFLADELNLEYEPGNLLRYGQENAEPGVTDMTASIQAAVDAVFAAGGGVVDLPEGTFGVTNISLTWTTPVSIKIRGAGKTGTILKKIGATTTPIFSFSAATLQTPYLEISDMQLLGNAKGHNGIDLTLIARLELRQVAIFGCDVALNAVGALIFGVHECTLNANNIGYKCRKSGNVYANLVQFYGGGISSNTSFGVDIGEASGVHFYGVDFEANGTTTDTTTGAVMIRNTVDDELSVSHITFKNCWMESNLGMTLQTEAATGLMLTIEDTHMIGAESGNVADVGAIKYLKLQNVSAGTSGDTVISAATRTLIIGGVIHTYTDNSSTISIGHASGGGTTVFTTPAVVADDLWVNTELHMKEVAAVGGNASTYGQLVVLDTTPQQLWFYNEDGTGTQLV